MSIDRELGKHYGYPKCCIDYFEKHSAKSYWFRPLLAKYPRASCLIGTSGFIPCPKHLKMLEDGKILVPQIIKNRKESLPYPLDKESEIIREEMSRADKRILKRWRSYLKKYNLNLTLSATLHPSAG